MLPIWPMPGLMRVPTPLKLTKPSLKTKLINKAVSLPKESSVTAMLLYGQLTFQELRDRFGIVVENEAFLPAITPLVLPDWLRHYLTINQLSPAMAKSEKAVSEMLIAPVLSAVKENNADKIALFSGDSLTMPGESSGICDFIIAANPKAFLPEPPIIVLVEAKRQDLYSGIPQCVGEMRPPGALTNGLVFLMKPFTAVSQPATNGSSCNSVATAPSPTQLSCITPN
ncbi:hypothetical protein [Fibrella aquatilis]|uniref:Uncharacterized protein n=1 Tax=Fibrella aquatilis TaxID=2817059 RepID=A0A939G641_9BACT|nr:hypothetical protein [Fibrella aquatilis]MBO0931095.1 hypothetical protein [Fibrella aquatilis]